PPPGIHGNSAAYRLWRAVSRARVQARTRSRRCSRRNDATAGRCPSSRPLLHGELLDDAVVMGGLDMPARLVTPAAQNIAREERWLFEPLEPESVLARSEPRHDHCHRCQLY